MERLNFDIKRKYFLSMIFYILQNWKLYKTTLPYPISEDFKLFMVRDINRVRTCHLPVHSISSW